MTTDRHRALGMPLTAIETVDEVLRAHASALGPDLTGYRNHVYRVINLALLIVADDGDADGRQKIAVAAVHHDLGIWTHHTFDYIAPSVELASAFLASIGRSDWQVDVGAMIAEHHRVTPYRGAASALVEPFRQADWIDVTYGWRTFGLRRRHVRALRATWPDAGFHARLVRLAAARLRSHPWSPLPMLKL